MPPGSVPLLPDARISKGANKFHCDNCGATIVGTLICSHCGEIKIQGLDAFDELKKIIGIKVKNDEESIATTLRTGFSAVTTEPNNLLSQAPTSEGKTHPIVETLSLFPTESVWFLGGLSPTAMAHDHGVLVNSVSGELLDPILQELYTKLDEMKGPDKRSTQREIKEIMKGAAWRVDLDNKIIVFLDNPNQNTLNRLRPILSHDVWQISYRFTDRMSKGSTLRTVHTQVEGWPATIAAMTKSKADKDTWDQMTSRFVTTSPNQGKNKYRAAVQLTSIKRGLPQPILDIVLENSRFEWARKCIEKIWKKLLAMKQEATSATCTNSPNMFWVPFYNHIGENFPAEVGRHMRDSQRFMTSLNMGAAINVFARPTIEIDGFKSIIVTRQDYERAIAEFFEGDREGTLFTGVAVHILDFFKLVVLNIWPAAYVLKADNSSQTRFDQGTAINSEADSVQGIELQALVKGCKNILKKSLSSDTIRKNYLYELENAGLMDKIPHPNDKRKNLHIVLREDLNAGNSGESLISGQSDIFSFECLKEALNGLEQIAGVNANIVIEDFDGARLNLEELYQKYFQGDDDHV